MKRMKRKRMKRKKRMVMAIMMYQMLDLMTNTKVQPQHQPHQHQPQQSTAYREEKTSNQTKVSEKKRENKNVVRVFLSL
jgi:hypothetical protein